MDNWNFRFQWQEKKGLEPKIFLSTVNRHCCVQFLFMSFTDSSRNIKFMITEKGKRTLTILIPWKLVSHGKNLRSTFLHHHSYLLTKILSPWSIVYLCFSLKLFLWKFLWCLEASAGECLRHWTFVESQRLMWVKCEKKDAGLHLMWTSFNDFKKGPKYGFGIIAILNKLLKNYQQKIWSWLRVINNIYLRIWTITF